MKREGVNRMFPFAIQDISEWDSRYEQKKQPDGLNKVCGEPPCLSSNRK